MSLPPLALRPSHIARRFALTPIALCLAQAAAAQTPPTDAAPQLQEVRINASSEQDMGFAPVEAQTASKAPMRRLETPQSVSVVTREQMESRQITNVQQALQTVAGVRAQHLQTMRNKHAITLEHLRMGALKGQILDSDGTVDASRTLDHESAGEQLHLNLGATSFRTVVPVHQCVDDQLTEDLNGVVVSVFAADTPDNRRRTNIPQQRHGRIRNDVRDRSGKADIVEKTGSIRSRLARRI